MINIYVIYIMPNVRVDNQFNGNWKDYKMFSLTAPSDGRKYITGYRKSDGKQLRRYEYQRDIMTDDEIPNTIDEINKIVSYKANPREWMKLYMRARRKLDYDGGGTRDNPKPAFPDSNFQREGARKRGPGKARDKEEDKKKLIKMRRRIKEGKIKEDKEREALKRKYEEQYKINKIYDSYLDMLADKSEEEMKEFEEKEDIKRTKKQKQNFIAAYRAAQRKAEDRESANRIAQSILIAEQNALKKQKELEREEAEKQKKLKADRLAGKKGAFDDFELTDEDTDDEEEEEEKIKEKERKEKERKEMEKKEKKEKEEKLEKENKERLKDERRNLKQLEKEAKDLRLIITDEDDIKFDLRSFGKNGQFKFSELTESQLKKHNKRNEERKRKLKVINKKIKDLENIIKKLSKDD